MSGHFQNPNLGMHMALGLVDGVKRVQLLGHNAAITTSDETLWPVSSRYAQLTSAAAMEVISSSANDAAAGTGARTVSIELIDGNYEASTVTATLNGVAAVAITGTFIAVNKITVLTAGSGLKNAGTISVRTVAGSVVKCQMDIGNNLSNSFVYTIPAKSVGLLLSAELTANAAVTVPLAFSLFTWDTAGLGTLRGKMANATTVPQIPISLPLGSGLAIAEKTLIEATAISGGASDVFAMGELLVFDKSKVRVI